MKFRYDDNLKGDFLVVHSGGNAVAGCPTKEVANEDAAQRNERAKKFGLTCTYTVENKSDGKPVSKEEWEAAQAAKKVA